MGKTFPILLSAVLMATGCKTPDSGSLTKDGNVLPTAPENQKGSAFCWAYAIVAHLEQRFYEMTRGESTGGFRLNFSEEYLGLIRIAEQLIAGEPLQEGLKLSDSLALVEKYGIVPEVVSGKNLFKAKFEFGVATLVDTKAQAYWQTHQLPENEPIPAKDALLIVSEAAKLTPVQGAFLAAAMGHGTNGDSEFKYANAVYTPQTWAKKRLKFSKDDYYVLQFPDSGRGQFNDQGYTDEYQSALKLVKKALLYGYSVPISFNMIKGGRQKDGVLDCFEVGCWDTDLAVPSPSSPHANHAVLLIDYRADKGPFTPASPAKMQQNYEAPPDAWVIKNSWGFNSNTSNAPELLKRFPLPAFTVMLQDYYEVSHKLDPGRYEALLPRNVCLRDKDRTLICEALISAQSGAGMPAANEMQLQLNMPLITANQNHAVTSRYPVEYKSGLPDITDANKGSLFTLTTPGQSSDVSLDQFNLIAKTTVSAVSGMKFNLCSKVAVTSSVKYVAMYVTENEKDPPAASPTFILSQLNDWQYCFPVETGARTFHILLQSINENFKSTAQISTRIVIEE